MTLHTIFFSIDVVPDVWEVDGLHQQVLCDKELVKPGAPVAPPPVVSVLEVGDISPFWMVVAVDVNEFLIFFPIVVFDGCRPIWVYHSVSQG